MTNDDALWILGVALYCALEDKSDEEVASLIAQIRAEPEAAREKK